MIEDNKKQNDIVEIDLKKIILDLWHNKWFVIIFTSVFFMSAFAYVMFFQQKNIQLDLKPITTFEVEKYTELNNFEIYNINREDLINIFVERFNARKELIDVIKKLDFIRRDKYATEQEWNAAVEQFAYSIKLIPPTKESELATTRGVIKDYWTVEVRNIKDTKLLTQVLYDTFRQVEEEVRIALKRRFETKINIIEKNTYYKLEDIDRAINNAKLDYETLTNQHLAFLKEQAQIARSVNIAKNTLESQTIQSGNSVIATNESTKPFYFRGYEAIEEEIKLIEQREKKELFISNLLELEQEKRALLQDPITNRVKLAFELSPIVNSEQFSAIQLNLAEIRYIRNPSPIMILFSGILLGLVFSVLIVLLKSTIKLLISSSENEIKSNK